MSLTRILVKCGTVTLALEIWPWVKVVTHNWVMDNNFVKYYPDPTWKWGVMAQTRILGICALWPWPWRYDLGSWTTIVWNINQIQHDSKELWPGHGFWVCVHCDLDFGDMRPWYKVITQPWVMDNNCVKYYIEWIRR